MSTSQPCLCYLADKNYDKMSIVVCLMLEQALKQFKNK